jgi:hypothetical protein
MEPKDYDRLRIFVLESCLSYAAHLKATGLHYDIGEIRFQQRAG